MINSCSEPTKEKYFERSLVNAFKHRSFDEFKKFIITPEDTRAGLSSNSNLQIDNTELTEEYKRTYIADYKRIFDQIITQGEKLGLNWGNVEFDNFLYNINDPIPGSGLQLMNCHINIKENNKNYFLYGIDAQEYKSGYKISYIGAIKSGRLEKYIDSNNSPEPN
jgi:hypothetical protein